MDPSVKENIKSKKILTQKNVQEIWDTMKRPTLKITGREDGGWGQRPPDQRHRKIVSKQSKRKFPDLKKELSIKAQETR